MKPERVPLEFAREAGQESVLKLTWELYFARAAWACSEVIADPAVSPRAGFVYVGAAACHSPYSAIGLPRVN
jgi:hypothetical protein